MTQNKRPRDESMQLLPPDFLPRHPKHTMEKNTASSNISGKTGYLPAENGN
jgi:hypothetical protein